MPRPSPVVSRCRVGAALSGGGRGAAPWAVAPGPVSPRRGTAAARRAGCAGRRAGWSACSGTTRPPLPAAGTPSGHSTPSTEDAAGRAAIIAAASDGDPSVRRQALRQLGTRRVREAGGAVKDRLSDVDAGVRFQASVALGRIGDPAAIPALIEALGERRRVREVRRLHRLEADRTSQPGLLADDRRRALAHPADHPRRGHGWLCARRTRRRSWRRWRISRGIAARRPRRRPRRCGCWPLCIAAGRPGRASGGPTTRPSPRRRPKTEAGKGRRQSSRRSAARSPTPNLASGSRRWKGCERQGPRTSRSRFAPGSVDEPDRGRPPGLANGARDLSRSRAHGG